MALGKLLDTNIFNLQEASIREGGRNKEPESATQSEEKWLIKGERRELGKLIWKPAAEFWLCSVTSEMLRNWTACCLPVLMLGCSVPLPPWWMNLLWCLLFFSSSAASLHHFLCLRRRWITKDSNAFLRSSLTAGGKWPVSLQMYLWFSYSVICVSLIPTLIISQMHLSPRTPALVTCVATVAAQGFPRPYNSPWPELAQRSCASVSTLASFLSLLCIWGFLRPFKWSSLWSALQPSLAALLCKQWRAVLFLGWFLGWFCTKHTNTREVQTKWCCLMAMSTYQQGMCDTSS